jgi:hypothetical protein
MPKRRRADVDAHDRAAGVKDPTPALRSGRTAKLYRHRQLGWVFGWATAAALVLATALLQSLSEQTIATAGWMVYALYALIVGAFLLFGWLVVEVDRNAIDVRFGVGLIGRHFDVADVRRCDRIRTRIWWGWGLHWTPSGWLYNVSGRDAVRVEFASQQAVMIGTDDADGLVRAIETARRMHS